MLNWIPMTDDDWEWLNPPRKPEPIQTPARNP
jgi:hypothetical protein